MIQKRKGSCFFRIIVLLFIVNLFPVPVLYAQNRQEIEVTIGGVSASDKLIHFANGEELRAKFKFHEAIAEYEKVISGGEFCEKEAEAHYDIGLCYTWLGELDQADSVFNRVIASYADNGNAVAFAEYGLAWVDVQRKNYMMAIERLQQTLDKKLCSDPEHCAVMLFQIGRIYLAHLNNYEQAQAVFANVLDAYPNANIINHSYFKIVGK